MSVHEKPDDKPPARLPPRVLDTCRAAKDAIDCGSDAGIMAAVLFFREIGGRGNRPRKPFCLKCGKEIRPPQGPSWHECNNEGSCGQ